LPELVQQRFAQYAACRVRGPEKSADEVVARRVDRHARRDAWSSSMPTTSAMRSTSASSARSATPCRWATDAIMQSIKPRGVTPTGRTNGWKQILNALTIHYGDRIAANHQ